MNVTAATSLSVNGLINISKKRHVGEISCLCFPEVLILCSQEHHVHVMWDHPWCTSVLYLPLRLQTHSRQQPLNVLRDPCLSQNEPLLFPPQSRSLLLHEPLSLPLDVSSLVAGAKEEIPQGEDSQ